MRTMLMATTGPQDGESEPVIVDTGTPAVVVLELDDGRVLCFSRSELVNAVQRTERLHDGSPGSWSPEDRDAA